LPGMIDVPLQTMIDEVLPSLRKLYGRRLKGIAISTI
jgi:hypothetical protein